MVALEKNHCFVTNSPMLLQPKLATSTPTIASLRSCVEWLEASAQCACNDRLKYVCTADTATEARRRGFSQAHTAPGMLTSVT